MLFEQAIIDEAVETKFLPFAPTLSIACDAIDLKVLNAFEGLQADDGSDLVVELIDLYLQDASERIESIKLSVARADRKSLTLSAHTLKGSSSSLGARHVAEISATLEQLDPVECPHRVDALLELLSYEFAKVKGLFAVERQKRLA